MPEMLLRWPVSAEFDAGAFGGVIAAAVAPHDGARVEVSLLEMPGAPLEPPPGFPFRIPSHPPRRVWEARFTAPTEAVLSAIQTRLGVAPRAVSAAGVDADGDEGGPR